MKDQTTSERPGSEPSRRRRHRAGRVVTGLSILVVLLAVFVWLQGGDDESGPLNAIAAAAERTQDRAGGRATMHAVVTSPVPSESTTMKGEMAFNDETERARMVLTVPRPESDGPLEMEFVTDGTAMYVRSTQFGSLPEGREWMGLDLSLGEELDAPLPASSDAEGELELLESVTGDVQTLGKEDVRGVPTRRYRTRVSVSEQVERLRDEGGEDLASVIEDEGTPMRIEAWVDANELVRRMRIVKSQPREEGEGSVTIDMRMDFFDFDFVPEIEVPDSDEVFDATDLARDEVGL